MANLPSPPFVDIPGIANFRDIGGQPTSSGQDVRQGLVFRSADPSKATEEGMKNMGQDLGMVCLPKPSECRGAMCLTQGTKASK